MKIDSYFKKYKDYHAKRLAIVMTDIYICSIYLEWPLNPIKNSMARHLFGVQLRNALRNEDPQ